jgi:type III restriction enzyme
VKNHSLGLEIPYRFGSENRKYRPDFIVRVDDGRGGTDLLNLVVEIKGYRAEDAAVKKTTMDTYWVPGVNHLQTYGRWAFVELKDLYKIQSDFSAKIGEEFETIMSGIVSAQPVGVK